MVHAGNELRRGPFCARAQVTPRLSPQTPSASRHAKPSVADHHAITVLSTAVKEFGLSRRDRIRNLIGNQHATKMEQMAARAIAAMDTRTVEEREAAWNVSRPPEPPGGTPYNAGESSEPRATRRRLIGKWYGTNERYQFTEAGTCVYTYTWAPAYSTVGSMYVARPFSESPSGTFAVENPTHAHAVGRQDRETYSPIPANRIRRDSVVERQRHWR
jgi:hypothetical protein